MSLHFLLPWPPFVISLQVMPFNILRQPGLAIALFPGQDPAQLDRTCEASYEDGLTGTHIIVIKDMPTTSPDPIPDNDKPHELSTSGREVVMEPSSQIHIFENLHI